MDQLSADAGVQAAISSAVDGGQRAGPGHATVVLGAVQRALGGNATFAGMLRDATDSAVQVGVTSSCQPGF